MLKALPSALMLVFAQPGWTQATINTGALAGLPVNGEVKTDPNAVQATLSNNNTYLTITQTGNRAIIDWTSFNIGAGNTVKFAQPSATAAVLNRVTGAANPSEIFGTLTANGIVMLMNPNGIAFRSGSSVNVGSLIATTGVIDENHFLNSGNGNGTGNDSIEARITQTPGNNNGIVNEGSITATGTATRGGLVALVAPSVVNKGTITAIGGTIALLGTNAATISLNNGLYEFALPPGAAGVAVSNMVGASLNAANINLGVGDAANMLSGVINLEGIQQASSAIVVNGDTVVLQSALQAPSVSGNSNTVNVSGAGRIQDGVNIAKSGGAVNVAAGSYVQPATLKIEKSLTLSGAGEGSTVIDSRGINGNGIEVKADNVTLKDFTLYGPLSYGIKVAPASATNPAARLRNFAIRQVTIRGSGRAELDLNGVDGALIDRVTADGLPFGGGLMTEGAGIQITDSANVTVRNSTTRDNKWGGLAIYQANRYYDQQVNNIRVEANNNFTEINPVYLQDESASRDFGTLNIDGFDFAVRNTTTIPQTNFNQYTWLQRTQQDAFNYAVNIPDAPSAASYVQGWNGAAATQNFHVGTGSLLGGGTQAMSIGSAVGAASAGAAVDVYAGTYTEQVVLNKANMTLTGHQGANLNVLEGDIGVDITANGVTVDGMQITGPYSQNFTAVNWDAVPTKTAAITVRENVSGARILNNNIKNVRTGVQVLDHAAVAITGNTFDNTKGSILVRSNNVTMSGNTRGPSGNEWDIVFLGHVDDGAYFVSPHVSQTQYGSGMMDMSRANGNMHILDRRYGSRGLLGSTDFGNRTHIVVSAGESYTAVHDFNLGNGLGNARQPLGFISDGINAVVSGGVVEVKAGTYAESLSITKALTLHGAGAGQSVITPAAGNAVTVSGNIGTSAEVLIDGFTFRNAPDSGVRVKNDTVLRKLTVRNSDFLHNGKFGFFAEGSATAGIPGLQNVSLLNSTFTGNGAPYTSATSLGQGDINFNYYNGNATLKDLRITGETEFVGIQFRGYHDNVASGGVHDAGRLEFDNVTIEGSFRRPSGSAGSWNPEGPGDAVHLLEYGSVANVSFNNVVINPSVGHGMFLEGLGSTLDIGNTRFGAPDSAVAGIGSSPTRSWNIYAGSNDRNNVKTNVNATRASFTGSVDRFAIEDRVHHALDVAGLGVVSWDAGNLYVTQASGSIQRGVDAASTGNTVNIAAGVFAEDVVLNDRYNLLFNDTRLRSLKLNSGAQGSGIGGVATAEGAGGFVFDASVNLLADTSLTTLGANISFNRDIQNAGGVARGLRLIAGSGSTRGNVHMTTGGSEANALGRLDISTNDFILDSTLWVGGYKIDALGKVTLSDSTLRAQDAGAANTLSAGGDVTGSINSLGSVEIVSGSDIVAKIKAPELVAKAQGSIDAVLDISKSAAFESGGATNVSGSAPSIAIDAPRGSVTGSFGQVTNTGGGLLNVNGKPQGNQTLSNTENNRVIPSGNALDDAGSDQNGVQVASANGFVALSESTGVSLSSPEAAGEAIDSGKAVELDLSPKKQREEEKDKAAKR